MFVASHRGDWERLEALLGRASRPRRLGGAEVDELVDLYQRTATHLSVVQSAGADPVLLARLSSLVARARGAVAGGRPASLATVARFLRVDFPAICYRTRRWWLAAAAGFLLVATGYALLLINDPAARLAIAPPDTVRAVVDHGFRDYYSSAPAQDFAARVFTNNALIAGLVVAFGVLLGLPVVYLLYSNARNVGVAGGLLISHGQAGQFFGLILPHGMLELTAVFVASGLGLKVGWTVVDPGGRTRGRALAEEGRALVAGAVGLALMLLCSGLIEAFVTPSGLPTWARIGIGALAEVLFLAWVWGPGRRAVLAGETGDVSGDLRGDARPAA